VSGVRRYAQILRLPHVAALTAAAALARMPLGIIGLALVLFLRERTGSYAAAGGVAAAFAIGSATAAPYAGRLVDRLGARRVLVPMTGVHAGALLAVVAAGYAGVPLAAMVALGGLAGCAMPPVSSVMRTLWPDLLAERTELLSTAFALDAVIVELVFVTGPALVALLTALIAPAAALVLSSVLSIAGTLVFTAQPPSRERHASGLPASGGIFGALRSPGLLTLVLATLPLGFTLGATEVILPAFCEVEGDRALAGVLLAIWSVGSAAGGIAYGARTFALPLAGRFERCALLMPVSLLPLVLAPSVLTMAILLVPVGAVVAPTLASANQLVGQVTPAGEQTEAYTWPLTALVLGVAGGTATAGAVVQAADWRTALLVAAGTGLLSAVVVVTRRATLRPLAAA
jgi:MFS family permease